MHYSVPKIDKTKKKPRRATSTSAYFLFFGSILR
jgi:hypothetical protein